ncbi:MAG: hypothetical protein ACPGNV_01530 [Mangrovicoccus sp.]
MATTEKQIVKGGWIEREAGSGSIVSVGTPKGSSFSSDKSKDAVIAASSKRKDALKRLANR